MNEEMIDDDDDFENDENFDQETGMIKMTNKKRLVSLLILLMK